MLKGFREAVPNPHQILYEDLNGVSIASDLAWVYPVFGTKVSQLYTRGFDKNGIMQFEWITGNVVGIEVKGREYTITLGVTL